MATIRTRARRKCPGSTSGFGATNRRESPYSSRVSSAAGRIMRLPTSRFPPSKATTNRRLVKRRKKNRDPQWPNYVDVTTRIATTSAQPRRRPLNRRPEAGRRRNRTAKTRRIAIPFDPVSVRPNHHRHRHFRRPLRRPNHQQLAAFKTVRTGLPPTGHWIARMRPKLESLKITNPSIKPATMLGDPRRRRRCHLHPMESLWIMLRHRWRNGDRP